MFQCSIPQDQPKILRLGNVLHVLTPYSASFVSDLKLDIPASARKWDSNHKAWVVDASYLDTVKRLVMKHFMQVQVHEANTIGAAQIKKYDSYLVEYVARCKDDGYALAWADNGFTVRFSERVLRAFFEMGVPLDSAPVSSSVPTDYFQVLGIKQDATDTEIKSAWRRGIMTWHPDRNSEPDAREWFDAIQLAYDVLKDPMLRVKYEAGRKLESLSHMPTRKKVADVFGASYVPPVRCGRVTFEAVQGVYLDVSKILKWDDDIRDMYGVRCIRVALPKRPVFGAKAEKLKTGTSTDFFLTTWEAI